MGGYAAAAADGGAGDEALAGSGSQDLQWSVLRCLNLSSSTAAPADIANRSAVVNM